MPETPPQTRGILSVRWSRRMGGGNTPADAGNIRQSGTLWHPARKHPRRRGEYTTRVLMNARNAVTPPQTRGIFLDGHHTTGKLGNTPADAGNIPCLRYTAPGMRKHPRRRGEYDTSLGGANSRWETPPRMRGILTAVASLVPAVGNTSADAGNIRPVMPLLHFVQKHPRRRGEYKMGNYNLRGR